MAEFSSLNGYDIKDKKAIRYYDNVADMKSDESIKEGQTIATLGYYSVNDGGGAEYVIVNEELTDDGGLVHELNNGLFAKLIVKGNILFFNQLGGKPNDYQVDSTPILQNIIEKLNSANGGTIIFDSGVYHFNGELAFTGTLSGITLRGTYKNGTGTILQYNKTETFISLDTIDKCNFEYMYIQGNTNSSVGIIINVSNNSNFKKITFRWFKTLIKINDFGYTDFTDCRFFCFGSCEKGFVIGNNYSEFLYFNRCAFDGGYGENLSPLLLEVSQGRYIYFNQCDFCNTRNYAIKLTYTNSNLQDVYFTECTFSHILQGIMIGNETTQYHIRSTYFIDCLYELDGVANEKIFIMNTLSSSGMRKLYVKGMTIKNNGSTPPVSIFECTGSAPLQDVLLDIAETNISAANINISYNWDSVINIHLPNDVISNFGRLNVQGNGGNEYTFVLSTHSPWRIPPVISTQYLSAHPCNYHTRVTTSLNGNLELLISFADNIAQNTTIPIIYKIN